MGKVRKKPLHGPRPRLTCLGGSLGARRKRAGNGRPLFGAGM